MYEGGEKSSAGIPSRTKKYAGRSKVQERIETPCKAIMMDVPAQKCIKNAPVGDVQEQMGMIRIFSWQTRDQSVSNFDDHTQQRGDRNNSCDFGDQNHHFDQTSPSHGAEKELFVSSFRKR